MLAGRLTCLVSGHNWSRPRRQIFNDLFGNEWRLRFCRRCGTQGRVLHKSWSSQ